MLNCYLITYLSTAYPRPGLLKAVESTSSIDNRHYKPL